MQPPVFSRPLQRLIMLVAVLIPVTSSFDIFLIVNIGGNFRFCQIVAPILIALAIVKANRRGRLPVLALLPLCLWLAVQCTFIPATNFWPKSVAYCVWLAVNIALMFSYVQLFGDDTARLQALLRCYIFSFVIIAGFGVLQFTLPLLGLPAILVTQWWIPDFLPRANGFSYEPSYFATYLLIGFVLVSALRYARSPLLSRRALTATYWVLALGIILSSSRMGIIFLLLEIGLSQIRPWAAAIGDFAGLRLSRSRMHALAPSLLMLMFVSALGSVAAIALERNPMVMLMFLNGTGISDTAAHSVLEREGSFEETLQVFAEHPLIGRSLGGVSSAIANLNGETVHSFEESKPFEGMSVFAEGLAGSGLFGFIPFVWFLIVTIREPLRIARATSPFHSALLHAFVRSLVFAWAILQVNQNMLRPYLWVHLAMLATVYASARKAAA
jgi:hypothetical protein